MIIDPIKEGLIYFYELVNGEVYRSKHLDYRMLNNCARCLRSESNNLQVLKDNFEEWQDYPITDKQFAIILLKAKDIPRSWHQLYWGAIKPRNI